MDNRRRRRKSKCTEQSTLGGAGNQRGNDTASPSLPEAQQQLHQDEASATTVVSAAINATTTSTPPVTRNRSRGKKVSSAVESSVEVTASSAGTRSSRRHQQTPGSSSTNSLVSLQSTAKRKSPSDVPPATADSFAVKDDVNAETTSSKRSKGSNSVSAKELQVRSHKTRRGKRNAPNPMAQNMSLTSKSEITSDVPNENAATDMGSVSQGGRLSRSRRASAERLAKSTGTLDPGQPPASTLPTALGAMDIGPDAEPSLTTRARKRQQPVDANKDDESDNVLHRKKAEDDDIEEGDDEDSSENGDDEEGGSEEEDEEDENEDDDEGEHDSDEDDMDEDSADADHILSNILQRLTGVDPTTLRAVASRPEGAMSSRLRKMLNGMRSMDPSEQFMALQELNDLLAMSTEENLGPSSGVGFDAEVFTKEIVRIITGESNALGVDNPELQLLACRCISNLVEALPTFATFGAIGSTRVIPALCAKLMSIEYIDVAEQAISTIERISREQTKDILKEGGVDAVLNFMDFFSLGVQRTAVQCVANALDQLPRDMVPHCKSFMPKLSDLLVYHDQKIVEMTCAAVGHCINGVSRQTLRFAAPIRGTGSTTTSLTHPESTADVDVAELIITPALLHNINQLLLVVTGAPNPTSTVTLSPPTAISLLHNLRTVADISMALRVELLRMDIGATIVMLMTGAETDAKLGDDFTGSSEYLLPVLDLALALLPPSTLDKKIKDGRDLLGPWRLSATGPVAEVEFSFPDAEDVSAGGTPSAEPVIPVDSRKEFVAFCNRVLPLAVYTFLHSVNMAARIKCMLVAVRIVAVLDSFELGQVLADVPFSSFIARAASRFIPSTTREPLTSIGDSRPVLDMGVQSATTRTPAQNGTRSLTMLTYIVYLCSVVMSKLPLVFDTYLRREGVVHELRRMRQVFSQTVHPADLKRQRSDYGRLREIVNVRRRADNEAMMARYRGTNSANAAAPTRTAPTTHEADVGNNAAATGAIVGRNWRGSSGVERPMLKSKNSGVIAPPAESNAPVSTSSASALSGSTQDNTISLVGLKSFVDPEEASLTVLAKQATLLAEHYLAHVEQWYGHELGLRAERVIADYGLGTKSVTCGTSPSILEALTTAARELNDSATNPNKADMAIARISKFFETAATGSTDTQPAITTFELLESGLVANLTTWLLPTAVDGSPDIELCRARMNAFSRHFFGGTTTRAGQLLVHLYDALSRLEFFELVSPFALETDGGGASMSSINAALLTRQLRIRLEPDAATASHLAGKLSSAAFTITVHSVAEFRALEDYVLGKIEGLLVTREETQTTIVNSGNSTERLATTTDASTTTFIHHQHPKSANDAEAGTADRGERVRHDSSFVHDVEGEEASGLNRFRSASTSAAGKSGQRKLGVRFHISDMAIPSDLTVYGAIHRFEAECRARAHSSEMANDDVDALRKAAVQTPPMLTGGSEQRLNAFGNVYTIKYRVLLDAEHAVTDSRAELQDFERCTEPLMRPCNDADGFTFDAACSTESNADLSIVALKQLPPAMARYTDHACMQVLLLARMLYMMNQRASQLSGNGTAPPISITKFQHRKLTAKLKRQLADILIAASDLLPTWSLELCRSFSFLFPYDIRLHFMQSAYFSSSRVLMKWQQQENPNSVTATQRQSNGGNILQLLMSGRQEEIGRALGRISRQKVRIARDRLFDSALKVIGLYAAERRFLMEIEFFDEVGSGLGPTLEFYALVGREWQRLGLQMWRTDSPGSANGGDYVQTGDGLFPLTLDAVPKEVTATVLKRFRLLGMFVAKAMFDFRLIDIDFHRLFLHKVFMRSSVSTTTSVEGALVELAKVDKNLARSLRALAEEKNEDAVAEMCLDFTLPGHPNVELVPGGAVLTVTAELVPKYICALFEAVAGGGVEQQVCAFRDGFNAVFPAKALQVLGEEEIISIFSSGEWEGRWERDVILDAIKVDHGFTKESPVIHHLLDALTGLDQQEQRLFVQFVTGAPKLPAGGFRALVPPLTVVCKTSDTPDAFLPSVMTCANYLKLPQYSSAVVLRERLLFAISEGQGSFHLS